MYRNAARRGSTTDILNMHKILLKIGRVVLEICPRTDGQTDRHCHHNTMIPYRGRSNNTSVRSYKNSYRHI